jgi:hypothetical protein
MESRQEGVRSGEEKPEAEATTTGIEAGVDGVRVIFV